MFSGGPSVSAYVHACVNACMMHAAVEAFLHWLAIRF